MSIPTNYFENQEVLPVREESLQVQANLGGYQLTGEALKASIKPIALLFLLAWIQGDGESPMSVGEM